jgi:hypothetical protein
MLKKEDAEQGEKRHSQVKQAPFIKVFTYKIKKGNHEHVN